MAKNGSKLAKELAGAIRVLFNIEGVQGVGQPVTLISPDALPMEFLGFIERLRAGPVEPDEEMLLLTLPGPNPSRRKSPATERVRQALAVLTAYATNQGVSAEDVKALLDQAKHKLTRPATKTYK